MDIFSILIPFAFVLDIALTEISDDGSGAFFNQLSTIDSLSITATQNPVPLGGEVILACGPGPIDEFTATWLFKDSLLPEQSDLTMFGTQLTLSRFQASQSGDYSCLNGDVLSSKLFLDFIFLRPNVRVDMTVPVLLGTDFRLTCVTQAVGVSFSWYRDKVPLTEEGSVLGGEMVPSRAAHYACAVVALGSESEVSADVSIDFKVPQPTVEPINSVGGGTIFAVGIDISLKCRSAFVSDAITPKIFWFKGNSMVDQENARYITDRATLTIQGFEESDAGAFSCVEELDGRQSERSESLAVTFSVPEIIFYADGMLYNRSRMQYAPLGSDVRVECLKDIDAEVNTVVWYSDHTREATQTTFLNYRMDTSTVGSLSCVIQYAQDTGFSGPSPVVQVDYQVPKPWVETLSRGSEVYLSEEVALKCMTRYETGRDESLDRRYTWFWYGQDIPRDEAKADGNTLTIPALREHMEGEFSCVEEINGVASELGYGVNMSVVAPTVQVMSVGGNKSFPHNSLDSIPLGLTVTMKCFDESNSINVASSLWRQNDVEVPSISVSAMIWVTVTMGVDTPGYYVCQVINNDRTTSAFSSPLYIGFEVPQPTVESSTGSVALVFGDALHLKCVSQYVNVAPSLKVHWFHNGDKVELGSRAFLAMDGHSYMNSNFQQTDMGSYQCSEEIDGLVSEKSTEIAIETIVPKPQILAPNGTTFMLGSRVTLVCYNPVLEQSAISGSVWFKNSVEVVPNVDDNLIQDEATLTFNQYRNADADVYACSNSVQLLSSELSDEFRAGYEVPKSQIIAPNGTTFMLGSRVTLVCYNPVLEQSAISGSVWFKNSVEVFPNVDDNLIQDEATLTFQQYRNTDADVYACSNSVQSLSSELSDEFRAEYKAIVVKHGEGIQDITIAVGEVGRCTHDECGESGPGYWVPQPGISVRNSTISLGTTTRLWCISSLEDLDTTVPHSARWYKNNSQLTADSHYTPDVFSLAIQDVTADQRGEYRCRELVGSTLSVPSEVVHLDVFVPTPEIRPDTQEVSEVLGTSFQLFCGSQVPVTLVEWRKNYDTLLWNTLQYTKNMTRGDRGAYACRVGVTALWSAWSSGKNVTFQVLTPEILPKEAEMPFLGSPLELTCNTSGFEPTKLEWRRDDNDFQYSQSIFREVMTPYLAGMYSCRVAVDGIWSEWSYGQNITFQVPRPTISGNESEVFLGDSVMMTCISQYKNDDVTDREYKWSALRRELNSTNVVIDDNVLLILAMTREIKKRIRCFEVIANRTSKRSRRFKLNYLVPRPSLSPANSSVTLDQPIELRCLRGYDHVEKNSRILWYKDQEAVRIDNTTIYRNDSRLNIVHFRVEDEGIYQCLDKVQQEFSEKSEGVSLQAIVPSPAVKVYYAEEIMVSPAAITLGSQFQIKCSTNLSADTEFAWQKGGITLSEERSNILQQGAMDLQAVDSYSCKVFLPTVARWSDWSSVLYIDFRVPLPTLYFNTTIPTLGDPFHLKCTSGYRKNHNSTFLWYLNGEVQGEEISDTYARLITEPSDRGVYECQENIGSKLSARSGELEIGYEVPAPVLESEPATAKAGETVVLACQSQVIITTLWESEFIWFFDDYEIFDQNSSVLELNNFQSNLTGPYRCQEQTGNVSSEGSNELYIRFQDPNSFIYTINNTTNALVRPFVNSTSQSTVPETSTIRLMCKYENTSYTHHFYWFRDNLLLGDRNGSSIVIKSFTWSLDGNYSCGVLFDGGIMQSNSIVHRTVDANALCSCPCRNTSKAVVMNDTEIEEMVSSIKKNLTVDTTSLSSKVRAKTSAPDSRPASISVGSVAVTFLILVPVIVISFDCINLLSYMADKYRTQCS